MEINYLISLITVIVTIILGQLAKKASWVSKNLIPIQNLLVGVIVAIVEWIITKDFSLAIATSGLFASGSYDIVHNLTKIKEADTSNDVIGADFKEGE